MVVIGSQIGKTLTTIFYWPHKNRYICLYLTAIYHYILCFCW